VHSGPFGCLKILGAKRAELVQKFVKRSRIGIFRNERTRSTPMDPILKFWCVRTIWVHSVLFGCLTKLDAKRAELEQKFVPRSHVEHSQRTHPIHPIGQYTDVLVRSYYLGAFRTVWLPYETRCKTCRTSAKFRATKWRRYFSQRMHQIHPIGHKTDVLERFQLFGCIRDRLVSLQNSVQNGPN